MRIRISFARAAFLLAVGAAAGTGCSSGGGNNNNDGSSNGDAGPVGGAVAGAADMHCVSPDGGQIAKSVGACLTDTGGTDAGHVHDTDAAAPDSGGGATSDFGETMFNAAGDDDDCKYHISWTSTPVRLDNDVTFTVHITRLDNGLAVTGADIQIEAFLTAIHPTPSVNIATTELGGGSYNVGPVRFDQAGMWTVRFHIDEMCSDAPEDSPHGHAAFFVGVP
jgi:hypothetical protein